MNAPVQLVTTGDSSTQLIINLAALQTLAAETRPVSVVSILGPARTGKSYLMNRLMGKSSKFINFTKSFKFINASVGRIETHSCDETLL